MCQTIFEIPSRLFGLPLFGFGLLLAAWSLGGVALAIVMARRQGWSSDTLSQLFMYALCGAALCFLPPRMHLIIDGGLPVRGYGVMLLVAVSGAVLVSIRRARQMGQDPEMILSCATWLFIGGIAGARLFYVIQKWKLFQRPTWGETIEAALNIAQGGLVVYGSLLAGGLALYLFSRKHRLPWLAMCDLVAPGLVLGMALGRVGCFMNGCCYGGPSDLPWAVQFPWNTPPFADQVKSGKIPVHGISLGSDLEGPPVVLAVEPDSSAALSGLKVGDKLEAVNGMKVASVEEAQVMLLSIDRPGALVSLRVAGNSRPLEWPITGALPRSQAVHPAQLYSTIDALLLCALLLAYSPFRRRDGELLALIMTVHPISRFLLEIIRVDEGDVLWTGMSISQNISLGIFAAGCLLWIYLLSRPASLAWGPHPAVA